MCEHPQWAEDERFATNSARVDNRQDLVGLIAERIRSRPASEWLDELERAGIPAGPINSVSQALADVQAQHRAMVRMIAGTPLVGSPIRIDGERADSELPPPALGEHTRQVLEELGIEPAEIARLKRDGVVSG